MIHLQAVLEAAEEVQAFCLKQGWRLCFIGGVALQRWGEPRLTQDADLTLLTGFGTEESFADPLLANFTGRRADARAFALRNRVLLVQTAKGVAVDIAFGAVPFEERSIQRASPWHWAADHMLTTCSAEDLVIHKAFAGRDRDWGDVESVLIRQRLELKLGLVRKELKPLLELKGQPDAMAKLDGLIATVKRRLQAKL
jgi:hypothetical protein